MDAHSIGLFRLLIAAVLIAPAAGAQTYPQKFGSDSMLPTYPKGSELEFSMPAVPAANIVGHEPRVQVKRL